MGGDSGEDCEVEAWAAVGLLYMYCYILRLHYRPCLVKRSASFKFQAVHGGSPFSSIASFRSTLSGEQYQNRQSTQL